MLPVLPTLSRAGHVIRWKRNMKQTQGDSGDVSRRRIRPDREGFVLVAGSGCRLRWDVRPASSSRSTSRIAGALPLETHAGRMALAFSEVPGMSPNSQPAHYLLPSLQLPLSGTGGN